MVLPPDRQWSCGARCGRGWSGPVGRWMPGRWARAPDLRPGGRARYDPRMDAGFVALFRHHAWASDRILSTCEALPSDQLEFVVQGTFGGLGATLRHLVEAEERYVRGLRGLTAPGPDAAGGTDRPTPPEALAPSVAVLRRRAAASGAALIELAEVTLPVPAVPRAATAVALAQSVEHRIVAPKVAGSSPVGHPTSRTNDRHGAALSGSERRQDCCRDCYTGVDATAALGLMPVGG